MATAPFTSLDEVLAGIADRERLDPAGYPQASIQALHDAGVIAAPFPGELGGLGWGLPDSVRAFEAIARSRLPRLHRQHALGLAGIYALGGGHRRRVCPPAWSDQIDRVAAATAGLLYAACNSEKGAGGSLAATRTTASRASDGAFRLRGEILASSGRHASTFFFDRQGEPGRPSRRRSGRALPRGLAFTGVATHGRLGRVSALRSREPDL